MTHLKGRRRPPTTVVEETPEQLAETPFNPYPNNMTVVRQYVVDHPNERAAVLAREQGGQNRVSLVAWLQSDSMEVDS